METCPSPQASPNNPMQRAELWVGNCETQTLFLGSWMTIKPSVYCTVNLGFIDVHLKIKALCILAAHRRA